MLAADVNKITCNSFKELLKFIKSSKYVVEPNTDSVVKALSQALQAKSGDSCLSNAQICELKNVADSYQLVSCLVDAPPCSLTASATKVFQPNTYSLFLTPVLNTISNFPRLNLVSDSIYQVSTSVLNIHKNGSLVYTQNISSGALSPTESGNAYNLFGFTSLDILRLINPNSSIGKINLAVTDPNGNYFLENIVEFDLTASSSNLAYINSCVGSGCTVFGSVSDLTPSSPEFVQNIEKAIKNIVKIKYGSTNFIDVTFYKSGNNKYELRTMIKHLPKSRWIGIPITSTNLITTVYPQGVDGPPFEYSSSPYTKYTINRPSFYAPITYDDNGIFVGTKTVSGSFLNYNVVNPNAINFNTLAGLGNSLIEPLSITPNGYSANSYLLLGGYNTQNTVIDAGWYEGSTKLTSLGVYNAPTNKTFTFKVSTVGGCTEEINIDT